MAAPVPAPATAPVATEPTEPAPATAPVATEPTEPAPATAPVGTEPPAPAAPTPVAPAPASAVAVTPAQQALSDTAKLEQIRQQERVYQASQLVDQARAAQNDNRLADALSLYTRAADLDPNNQAAVAGRAQIQTLTGRAPVPLLADESAGTDHQRAPAEHSVCFPQRDPERQ